MNEETKLANQTLTKEPEPLSLFETMFTYGFLKIIFTIWSPLIIVILGTVLFKKYKKNKRV